MRTTSPALSAANRFKRARIHFRVFIAPGNWNGACGSEEPVCTWGLENLPIHYEHRRAWNAASNDQRVGKANVVADHQRRAFFGQIVDALYFHSIQHVNEYPAAKARQELRHQCENIDRHQ